MKNNLIIGAGQLGSRHLQGLLKSDHLQTVYVLDSFPESLTVAKQRAMEIEHDNEVHYTTDWSIIPKELDLVIIATGANVRAYLTKQLLANYKVNFLVLEKVLFQDLASYDEIEELLRVTGTLAWVNHPRRLMSHYQQIKNTIESKGEIANFIVEGTNWGLACSALHFIDLFAFLSGSHVATLDFEWITNEILQSKRSNCIEFNGAVKGVLADTGKFMINSFEGSIGDLTVYISTPTQRWIVQEGMAQRIIHLSKENGFRENVIPFETLYQSSLTTTIANNLFEKGTTLLPTYGQASQSHIPFITQSLSKYIEISGIETKSCPIT